MKYKLYKIKNSKVVLRKNRKYLPQVVCDTSMVERLASLGLTPKEIAFVFGITEVQYSEAVRQNPELASASETGRLKAEYFVRRSLFKAATGYYKKEFHRYRYKQKIYREPYMKYIPPNVEAIIFWLTNRRPEEWKRNPGSRYGTGTYRPKLGMDFVSKLKEIADDYRKESALHNAVMKTYGKDVFKLPPPAEPELAAADEGEEWSEEDLNCDVTDSKMVS